MTNRSTDGARPPRLLLAAMTVLLAGQIAQAQQRYLAEDVRVVGKEFHAFTDAKQPVTVVLGPVQIQAGQRSITARDAVIWVSPDRSNQAGLREMHIYLEGDVRVVEPGGATTNDARMLVVLRHRGGLSAKGVWVDRPLDDYPLYLRARQVRQKYLTQADQAPDQALAVVSEPSQQTPQQRQLPPRPRTVEPVEPLEPLEIATVRLGKVTTRTVDDETRRITVAQADESGRIYLALGTAKSTDFLELRAAGAVIFSEKRSPQRARVPYAAELAGATSDLKGGQEGWKETITGIYLEGDVIIQRGERTLTGPRAYFDTISDRALVTDGVFRTIQEQRNVPIWIRAAQVRTLSAREMWFRDAKVSTSDFHSPTYHIGAKEAYVKDTTPYDDEGEPLALESFAAELKHTTFNVRSLPILYWPYTQTELQRDHTALRRITASSDSVAGLGVYTQWHLFRLLGIVRPEGYKGRLDLNLTERGPQASASISYARRDYFGYAVLEGMVDDQDDDFGDELENVDAPDSRGRILLRHKQVLESDWQLQFELSHLCDRNYLRQFDPIEHWAGKEQESLIYAKKTGQDWAFTALAKYRLNRFEDQKEAAPELAFWVPGKPLLDDLVTYHGEHRAGMVRFRHDTADKINEDSDWFFRGDSRNELALPLRWGPVNLTPYMVGRLTYWEDEPAGGENFRPYGQVGLRTSAQMWKVLPHVSSETWDLHGLRHLVQGEVDAWLGSSGGVHSDELYPLDADIEQRLDYLSGLTVGVHQRLQTRRGAGNDRQTVDWMRLSVVTGFYDNGSDPQPSLGQFVWYRPELSTGRNHVNVDYEWNISDSTALLADMNYDIDRDVIGQANAGFAVNRSPRLRYYIGWRMIRDLDSSVLTFSAFYQLNEKYSLTFTEQFDFDYDGKRNLVTSLSIVRKFPRWYVGFGLSFDARYDELSLALSLWPEGVPEFRIRGTRLSLLGTSDQN
ncbi:MAG: hypothetical protein ACLFUJ_00950 [Phycisphaerae bacterium]